MIKAILFDLDETIILDEAISHAAFAAAAARAAAKYPALDQPRLAQDVGSIATRLWAAGPYAEYVVRIGHGAWEGLWATYSSSDHAMIPGLRTWVHEQYRMATWREALAAQDVVDDEVAAACVAEFARARRRYPRYPEIDGLLAALAPQYKLGIVTNGVSDLQREKLAGCGVAHLFQAGVISGAIDCGKPDPGIFRHACALLRVQPDECVMVGDNPGRDIAGAIAVGMQSVWVQRGGRARDERYPATLECQDLSALLPWLASRR